MGKMNRHLIVGVFISAVLIYFASKGVSFQDVAKSIEGINYCFVLLSLLAMVIMQLLRSFRWGLLLRPLASISQITLFSVSSVGFLAIIALPARLGELVRPYIIAQKSNISIPSAISSVVVERILDGISITLFVAVIPFMLPIIPSWLFAPAIFFIITIVLLSALIVFLVVYKKFAVEFFHKMANKNYIHKKAFAQKIVGILEGFIDGFEIIKDFRLLLLALVISIMVWVVEVFIIHYMLLAFNIHLPIVAYLVLTVILIVSIAIPAAPGFIGSWHFACVLGLSFFGIAQDLAFAFGVVYHFFSMALLALLGFIFLPSNYFVLVDVYKRRFATNSDKKL